MSPAPSRRRRRRRRGERGSWDRVSCQGDEPMTLDLIGVTGDGGRDPSWVRGERERMSGSVFVSYYFSGNVLAGWRERLGFGIR